MPTEDALEREEEDEKERSKEVHEEAGVGCSVGDGDAERLGETSTVMGPMLYGCLSLQQPGCHPTS